VEPSPLFFEIPSPFACLSLHSILMFKQSQYVPLIAT
jgi:hypothetical protein